MSVKVSIIIPAYNGAHFIEQTVRAALRQTYQNWELLVINNASKDKTGSILANLHQEFNDPRFRIITNPLTLPPCENWNSALRQAQGEFIKLICADDIPTDDCVERQVKVLIENPTVVLTTGARTIINEEGKVLFTRRGIRRSGFYTGRDLVRLCLTSGTNIIGDPVHVMWRRSAMDKVGLFDPETLYASDAEFWLRLLTVGDGYCDSNAVGFYRIHGNADSAGQWRATARSFLQIAQRQVDRGHVKLSGLEMRIIATKAYLQGIARQLIYHFLG